MEDGIIMSIARFGAEVGMYLSGGETSQHRQIDRTALANTIVHSAVEQACEIVSKLGIVRQIDVERGEFGLIVGTIARELFSLVEALTDVRLSTADCSLDIGDTCVRAYLAMRR